MCCFTQRTNLIEVCESVVVRQRCGCSGLLRSKRSHMMCRDRKPSGSVVEFTAARLATSQPGVFIFCSQHSGELQLPPVIVRIGSVSAHLSPMTLFRLLVFALRMYIIPAIHLDKRAYCRYRTLFGLNHGSVLSRTCQSRLRRLSVLLIPCRRR